jgi:hypothetical protein
MAQANGCYNVNKVMHSVKPSPSKQTLQYIVFRIGYISQLWKTQKSVEFVRQTVG